VGSLHTSNDNKDKDTGFRVVDAVRAAFARVAILRMLIDPRARTVIASKAFDLFYTSRQFPSLTCSPRELATLDIQRIGRD